MPRKPYPFIKTVVSRGKTYEYFDTGKDVNGKRVYNRLPHRSDRSWGQVYAGMLAGRKARENIARMPTLQEVSVMYQRDAKFKKRSEGTQTTYLVYMKVIVKALGMAEVNAIERRDIRLLLDTMADRPSAANMTLIVLRNLFAYATAREWLKINPVIGVEKTEEADEEHEPWSEDLLALALADPEVRFPVALLYYTAQRIGDVCKMRWDDITDGYLYVMQEKGQGKVELDIKLHRDLLVILAEMPRTGVTILTDPKGAPVKSKTLRSQLQRWAGKQGHEIVPHGLRKNAVIALLEAGCTTVETSAISGQSLRVVEYYARRRNVRRIGTKAVAKWEGTE
jgi:integrase